MEPIAIVGIGCRLPGGTNTPDDFWTVISGGIDCVTEVPMERWNIDAWHDEDATKPGKMVTRRCGFIDDNNGFDAAYFKISPKEASAMDPQQRHLLEVTAEAFEDAGIIAEELHSPRRPEVAPQKCGVFIGVGMFDYLIQNVSDAKSINAYTLTGSAHSAHANRISYAFDLRGPSMAVDTACASSMTALHLACGALRGAECQVAVVAGSNSLIVPEKTVGFSQLGVLSPEGKCRPFSDDASGYVRSEGYGAVILKPLSAATKDGDHVYALVRGTAVSANGFSKSLTMPLGDAQEEVMRDAYSRAKIPLDRVSYVEAHGTGTPVGDPIEANAIGRFFRQGREEGASTLKIGSVKSNFGHTECSAGIVATIKAALMLDRKQLCPSINFRKVNPKIDLDDLNIKIQTSLESFTELRSSTGVEANIPIVIGVNSFGFAGAVAHAIFEEAPFIKLPEEEEKKNENFEAETNGNRCRIIPLSAKSDDSLMDLAQKWITYTNSQNAPSQRETSLAATIAWTAIRRQHHSKRLAIIANSKQEIQTSLQSFIDGKNPKNVVFIDQEPFTSKPKICFIFPGQGQQWADMGRELYRSQPIFREAINDCDAILKQIGGGKSLINDYGLFKSSNKGNKLNASDAIQEVDVIQPAILFMQIAFIRLWNHFGIQPDIIVGHSLGELAAAYAAGGLTLEEAVLIIHHRSVQQAKLTGTGRMAALRMNSKEAWKICQTQNELHIAAINGPRAVTVAGQVQTIDMLIEKNPSTAKKLRVTCAFHTPEMNPIEKPFCDALNDQIEPKTANIPFYSTVTGKLYNGDFKESYWWKNIRQPVLFQNAIEEICHENVTCYIELGASATLTSCIGQIYSNLGKKQPITISSGQRDQNDAFSFLQSVAKMYCKGFNELNWRNICASNPLWTGIPTYCWKHEQYWSEPEERQMRRLGLEDRSFSGQNGILSLEMFPFFLDHVVQDQIVFPGAGYVEFAIQTFFQDESAYPQLKDIKFTNVLLFKNKKSSISLECKQQGSKIYVLSPVKHFEASLDFSQGKLSSIHFFQNDNTSKIMNKEEIYNNFENLGLIYGPNFQKIEKIILANESALAYVSACNDETQRINVMLLDNIFQVALATVGGSCLYLPAAIQKLEMMSYSIPLKERFLVYSKVKHLSEHKIIIDLFVTTEDGKAVLKVDGFEAKNVTGFQSYIDEKSSLFTTKLQQSTCDVPKDFMFDKMTNFFNTKLSSEEGKAITVAENLLPKLKNIITTYVKHAIESVPKEACYNSSGRYYERFQDISELKTPYNINEVSNLIEKLKCTAPDFGQELEMTKQFGERLPDTLKDPASILPYMFSSECLDSFFWDSISVRIYYEAVANFIKLFIDGCKKETVRILELGGRIGGMTKKIMEVLTQNKQTSKVEYYFSDVSSTWFQQAQENLKEFDFIRYQQFNPEKNPKDQNFKLESFDIVINLDTIHASVSLENCIKNLKRLLCDGGALVILEATNTFNLTELWFGALEVCWTFNDFRKVRCWADKNSYKECMENVGLDVVTTFSTPKEFVHSILIGWKPKLFHNSQYHWLFVGTQENENDDKSFKQQFKREKNTKNSLVRALSRDGEKNKERIVYLHDNSKDRSLKKLIHYLQKCDSSSEIDRIFIICKMKDNSDLSGIQGLLRSVSNYLTEISLHTIFLKESVNYEQDTLAAFTVMESISPECEYIIENGVAMVPRICSMDFPDCKISPKNVWRVDQNLNGNIESMEMQEVKNCHASAGTVRIQVKAVAMNFKDVMKSLGLLDDLLEFETASGFGIECSGIIDLVAPNVKNLKCGDEVIAIGTHCLGSHALCDANLVIKKPKFLSWEEAAGLPIVYTTAFTALCKKANLKENETVLIHSACGGVGLAAINVANLCKAKVICSAGSEEKRNFLTNEFNIHYTTDSRSERFVQDVLEWTNGRGVDVVLNSLSGDLMMKGIEILAPGGRFVEIGKKDLLNNVNLATKLLFQNKSFISCQIDLMTKTEPETLKNTLKEILNFIESGTLKPVKTTVFNIKDYKSVFQTMTRGSHIGKNVLTIPENFQPLNLKSATKILDSEVCYMVTGALGGLGQSFVRWLVEMGAKNLILTSRSKIKTSAAQRLLLELEQQGINVKNYVVDMANENKVFEMVATVKKEKKYPLKGVFHMAGVIENESFDTLNDEQIERIMAAKVRGALALDQGTEGMELDHFVLFSSVVASWGQPAQPCYCAANSALDALAQRRRHRGANALSLQMGAVRGAGFLEKNLETMKMLEAKGMKTLHSQEIWTALKKLMCAKDAIPAVVCVANQNWSTVARFASKNSLLFSHLSIPKLDGASTEASVKNDRLTPEEAASLLREKLGELLGVTPEKVSLTTPMTDYGVDSLTAVELVNWCHLTLGVTVSQLDVLGGATVGAILERISC